jgi:hypothetical protein
VKLLKPKADSAWLARRKARAFRGPATSHDKQPSDEILNDVCGVQGPYLGYLQAQKQRLTGERGQKRIHRPELEEMYGFDTKYAMHMLRLGFQGVELLTTGRLSLPMREPERSYLLDVRRGKVSEQDCLTRAGELERELAELEATSVLPEAPAERQVEEWVLDAYRRSWRQ